jgi:hypothetical protein
MCPGKKRNFKVSTFRPEVVPGVYKNWQQICLNNLSSSQLMLALTVDERYDVTNTVRLITFIRAFDRAFMFVKSLELKLAYICF